MRMDFLSMLHSNHSPFYMPFPKSLLTLVLTGPGTDNYYLFSGETAGAACTASGTDFGVSSGRGSPFSMPWLWELGECPLHQEAGTNHPG